MQEYIFDILKIFPTLLGIINYFLYNRRILKTTKGLMDSREMAFLLRMSDPIKAIDLHSKSSAVVDFYGNRFNLNINYAVEYLQLWILYIFIIIFISIMIKLYPIGIYLFVFYLISITIYFFMLVAGGNSIRNGSRLLKMQEDAFIASQKNSNLNTPTDTSPQEPLQTESNQMFSHKKNIVSNKICIHVSL